MTKILQLNGSATGSSSVTTSLNEEIVSVLTAKDPESETIVRDLTRLYVLDNERLTANNTPADSRTPEQAVTAKEADAAIDDLMNADVLVIGVPMYNFGVSSAVKAWMDIVARGGTTFQYSEAGLEGLVKSKRAIVSVASQNVKLGDAMDFASGHIQTFLGFLGFNDIEMLDATALRHEPDRLDKVRIQISKL